jgi:16S rRNA (cytosine1402-N4)-methyltransferase
LCEHVPVLLEEVVQWLRCSSGGTFVDCTVGTGSHAKAILERVGPSGRLVAIDADTEAVARAQRRLSAWRKNVSIVQDSFRNLRAILDRLGIERVDGILFDLGLSSVQLDDASRGFAIYKSGPLDMRFNRRQQLTAAEIVNRYPEKEIVRIIREFGEEKAAARIAAAIVRRREQSPISSTTQLADLVTGVAGPRRGGIHPATKTFQSLRLAVNEELQSLREALPQAIRALSPKGKLAVIAYQSLEDRIVKRTFREFEKGCICPPSFPVCKCGRVSEVTVLTKKPIRPSPAEIERNPRSRSGRMRVCERREENAGT